MTISGDLLTAAGLLLATIGMVFAVWHAEIIGAINVKGQLHRDDRGPQITQVRRALLYRAAPLDLAVVLLIATLAPPALSVISHALTDDRGHAYDAVRAVFVVVWVLTVALGGALAELTVRLTARLRKLNRPDPPN